MKARLINLSKDVSANQSAYARFKAHNLILVVQENTSRYADE